MPKEYEGSRISDRLKAGEPLHQTFLCATLSKALGGYGGIIPGSERFIEHVRRASHWYDGATAPPAPVTAASARALELLQADPDLRTRLLGERAADEGRPAGDGI